jgi:hypothetical protein
VSEVENARHVTASTRTTDATTEWGMNLMPEA